MKAITRRSPEPDNAIRRGDRQGRYIGRMTEQAAKTEHFLALHHGSAPISVGGAFAFAAFDALADAAREFRERGSYGFLAGARTGRDGVRAAFSG